MKKVIKDGKVAVLVSPGYGAGWFSWTGVVECLYDPEIVNLVLNKASSDSIELLAQEKWPNEYWGGSKGLQVHWLPKGTQFRIDEYDGNEGIEYNSDIQWLSA